MQYLPFPQSQRNWVNYQVCLYYNNLKNSWNQVKLLKSQVCPSCDSAHIHVLQHIQGLWCCWTREKDCCSKIQVALWHATKRGLSVPYPNMPSAADCFNCCHTAITTVKNDLTRQHTNEANSHQNLQAALINNELSLLMLLRILSQYVVSKK